MCKSGVSRALKCPVMSHRVAVSAGVSFGRHKTEVYPQSQCRGDTQKWGSMRQFQIAKRRCGGLAPVANATLPVGWR